MLALKARSKQQEAPMTFHIDRVGLQSKPRGWLFEAQFKGYEGRSAYVEATIESGSHRTLIRSTSGFLGLRGSSRHCSTHRWHSGRL